MRALLVGALAALALPATAHATTVDLGVVQSDTPDPVMTGQVLTYSLVVSNGGPDRAKSVRLVDRLPRPVAFLNARAPAASCGLHERRLICSIGSLAAGATTPITIRVRPTNDRERYVMVNVATVGKRKSDSNPASNTSRERTTVENPPPVICAGRVATIAGTNANDALVGTAGRDVIAALSGDDEVVGLGGHDIVCGSGGRDLIRGEGGADVIKGGGGRDRLKGGDDNDRLSGKAGRDRLKGGRGSDVLRGGRGTDRCRGGGGSDIERSC